ncbi:hypothetical protein HB946_13520 [Listeria welshimeri]|uniref:LPD28 domain-containing protein n=1 Tax=Listeria welshimeri TaxID=1643 RepID=UPI001624513F|nr:LPD28 domain-containing protein [Listeria welshimeri]MBC1631713.1 hypothetical protein [Listeria welshimeri]MBC1639918.1 hypothetical protein [Listeria welshimeri]MBC1670570.1 hypothetical protein [Listeria welshimeri]MBC1678705.1 hypothetical protein [Listeria welshimeri]MBC1982309.1 hypothetical protein [Listeria welshimeri]
MTIENFDISKKYGLINIDGRMFLYNDLRWRRDSIPDGCFAYAVRDTDDFMDLAEINYNVMVNFSLDLLSLTELPKMDREGLEIGEWEMLGTSMTLSGFQEFMKEREVKNGD